MLLFIAIVIVASGICTLSQSDLYAERAGVEGMLIAMEKQWQDGDALYIGGYASPVVQFYQPHAPTAYLYGKCVGAYFAETLEDCATDIRDKINVFTYSRIMMPRQDTKLFLLFHGDVPFELLSAAIGRFYDGELAIESISAEGLYAVANFAELAASAAGDESNGGLGFLIISNEYNVYLSEERITYVNRHCNAYDTSATFFLDTIPLDDGNLSTRPEGRSFDRLEFSFGENGMRVGRMCTTSVHLPSYPISLVRAGQHVPLGPLNLRVWESDWRTIR